MIKRIIAFGLMVALSLAFMSGVILANEDEGNGKAESMAVNISALDSNDTSVGAWLKVKSDIWASVNFDGLGSSEGVRYSLSGLYEVPKKFLIWRFYGGLGIHVGSPSGAGLHLTAGSQFLCFFTEYEYDLNNGEDSIARGGIRLRF